MREVRVNVVNVGSMGPGPVFLHIVDSSGSCGEEGRPPFCALITRDARNGHPVFQN